ncbi:MAG: sensor histidine kinase [Qipengyuania sp.]
MDTIPVGKLGESLSNAVLDQLREGIIVTDRDGAIRYVNDAARSIHGVAELDVGPEEYSQRYHLFTLDGEPHPFEELPLARAVRGETVLDTRWIIRRSDGTDIHAVGNAKPLLDEEGEQVGAVLTIRDETERNRTQAELRESEETVRAFFETAGVYTAVLEVEDEDFLMVMGNGRMARALGLDQLSGQSARALLGDDRAQGILEGLRTALDREQPTVIEYPWPVGEDERWFVATLTAMRNRPGRLFHVSLDISDRKAAERDLAQALKTKDVLLHEVNHRVKNSLQIITSLLQLQERVGDEVLANHLREARGRVETVARVHERLYDTSAHDRVEVSSYLEDLLTNVVASVGRKDSIRYEFSHSGGSVELGVEYSVPLALILVEMAMNAAKYAFPGDKAGTVRVETSVASGTLTLTVSDDGVGMGSSLDMEGSGLGMRIVRALSSQLRADSAYLPRERGTAFQLSMPLPKESDPSRSAGA